MLMLSPELNRRLEAALTSLRNKLHEQNPGISQAELDVLLVEDVEKDAAE